MSCSWLQGTALRTTYRHVTSNREEECFLPCIYFYCEAVVFRASLSSCVHLHHQPQRPNQSLAIELRSPWLTLTAHPLVWAREGKSVCLSQVVPGFQNQIRVLVAKEEEEMAVGKSRVSERTRFLGLKKERCLLSCSLPFVYLLPLKTIRELFSTIFLK